QSIGIIIKKYCYSKHPCSQLSISGIIRKARNSIDDPLHSPIFRDQGHNTTNDCRKDNNTDVSTIIECTNNISINNLEKTRKNANKSFGIYAKNCTSQKNPTDQGKNNFFKDKCQQNCQQRRKN